MKESLENEINTYINNREKLISEAEGKFVLISNEKILGVFDTEMDAVHLGIKQLGNIAFLVKQISRIDTPLFFTSNLIRI
jgi:hypothetical protein